MATDIEFSFSALTEAARRHIRVFQVHQFLDRCAMGLTVAVVALALTDRGLDLFQISLLFGIYAFTTMAMELPFGGLADTIGRKPVFLMAVAASLMSLLLFLLSRDFVVLALSFTFIGFGRALRSGTLDAWFVERFRATAPDVDVQPALAKVQFANAMGLAMGAVLGGLLPDAFRALGIEPWLSVYDASYAASFLLMVCVFLYTCFAINEGPRPRNPDALWQGFARVPSVVAEAALLVLRHRTLSLLMAALALFLLATNPVEVFWPTYVKPMLDARFGTTIIGALTAAYFFAIAVGASLSPYISRAFGRRHAFVLAAAFTCLAGLQVALAMQGGLAGFISFFTMYAIVLGAVETPASSILHRCVGNHQRSTVLSLRSLVQQLGAAVGLVLAGAIAEVYSTSLAWSAGAVFLLAAMALCLVLAKHLAAETE